MKLYKLKRSDFFKHDNKNILDGLVFCRELDEGHIICKQVAPSKEAKHILLKLAVDVTQESKK